jgi:hypothetical protein
MKFLKTGLTLSLILNLILLGCLVAGLKPARNADNGQPLAMAARPATVTNFVTVSVSTPTNTINPFRWSQLESTNNYRAYVANLRAVGCPERSVRAIVMADMNALFFKKRSELNLSGTEAGPWSGQNEVRVTGYLLGETAGPSDTAPATNSETAQNQADNPTLPLIFENVDLTALGLGDEEKAAIQDLRRQFNEEIAPQNPSDPAYRERWVKAQSEIDALLRDQIGGPTFQDYQAAAQNAASSPPPAK